MKTTLRSVGLALLFASVAHAQYNPVPLTPSSFQYDIVIEKGAQAPLENYVNCTLDTGTNDTANTFFEQGYVQGMPFVGLPPHGFTFVSHNNPTHSFKMPPSYVTNNVAYVGASASLDTLVLVTQVVSSAFNVVAPAAYNSLSVLWASGGSGNVIVNVNHADNSQETFTLTTIDWFNAATTYDYIAMGRIAVDGAGSLNNMRNTTVTKLFSTDLALANTASAVTGVSFNYTSNSYRFFGFGLSGSPDGITYSPIDVSGFNYDCVVESNAQNTAYFVQGYNVTMDGGINGNANTFYEQGFCTTVSSTPLNRGGQASTAPTGLPHPGATITSGNYTFQMPASYAVNNCVFIGNYLAGAITNGAYGSPDYTTGSFTITSPQSGYTALSVLCSAGNGPVGINYTVNYSDGSTDTGTISALDWFNNTAVMFNAAGRVAVDGPTINNQGGSPAGALHNADIALTHPASTATNIAFSYASGGRAPLFAVSASTGGAFTPIAVTGYDADIIVEKEQGFWHGGLFTATTATMDLGTNNGNWTLFEKGWITNGYGIKSGMPPAGTTIASLQATNRFYQIQSYTAPNAILINANNTSANITPATPANYSAFAILCAGGSIGAGNSMSNLCILQHADGVRETNFFLGKDWFETGVPPAFIANGRGDTRGRAGGAVGASPQNPRLFESFFQLNDTGSPVTNILLSYQTGGGSCYVMAVSATAGAVQPFLGQNTVTPSARTFEGSNIVITATSGGTGPISYQWRYSSDGTNFSNLSNGGTISGATTASLNISSGGWTNTGFYQLAASNVAGAVTNLAINITIYSALPDIAIPTDPIQAYNPSGGSSPAGSEVIHVIEDLVGTNSNFIDFGPSGGTAPFVGPVGFIVFPGSGKTTVTAARFYTTEINQQNDPADWVLEGSNDSGGTWTPITSGPLALPAARNAIAAAAANPTTQNVQEIHFANSAGYAGYRVTFNNAFNNVTSTGIAVGEVELLGTNTYSIPVISRQPADVTVYAGGNPTFTVLATGAPTPLTYQWSRGGVGPIAGATKSSYTLVNAQLSDSTATFACTVTDTQGSTPSSSATLTVISGAPTQPYPVAVRADQPAAYLRLGEPEAGGGNNGVTAFDYFGGHNGSYSNTVLSVPGYNPAADPNTAAHFGDFVTDCYVGSIQGLDFAAPSNNAVAFSVEAWVLGTSDQVAGAGIVTKGYGGGGEQFNLDCGAGATKFRFFVRDASGNTHGSANSTIGATNVTGPFPGANAGPYSWHYLVGVCDEPHGSIILYVDGISNAAATGVLPTDGVLSSAYPVVIGARQPNVFTDYTLQFSGVVDDVAIYPYALTAAQVTSHYNAAHPLPVFTVQPAATTDYSENGPLVLTAAAYGPPALTFQWYSSPDTATWSPVSGQTSANFNKPNTPANLGPYLELVATDPYGSATSQVSQVTAHTGPPVISSDLLPTNFVYAGGTILLNVTVYGTAPLTFQWSKSADNVTYTPLSDSAHIIGSQSNVLAIVSPTAVDTAFYKLHVSNGQSPDAESVHEYLVIEGRPDFNQSGLGWALNGDTVNGGTTIVNNVLTLTDGTAGENRSAFYKYPLYVGAFQASFTYQDIGGGGADGAAFVLQNDTRGTTALGGGGGGLAYNGITPSVALLLNIYSGAPGGASGTLFGVNGVGASATAPYYSTTPVNLDTGNPVNVTALYNGGLLRVTMQDTVTSQTFTTNVNINIPAIVGGSTAFVGITGSEGGTLSHQTVSNFVFAPLPVLTAASTGPNTVVLSWSALIGGYTLQSKANVGDPNPASWVNVAAPVTQVSGQNQVTINPATGAQFYRLILPGNVE